MEAWPSPEEGKNLQEELAEALEKRNYTRAAWIGRRMNRPEEEVRSLQEKALRQYIVEFRNPQGVQALVEEYRFSPEDLQRFVQKILEETTREESGGKGGPKSQFDTGTMRFLTLEEWIRKYVLTRK